MMPLMMSMMMSMMMQMMMPFLFDPFSSTSGHIPQATLGHIDTPIYSTYVFNHDNHCDRDDDAGDGGDDADITIRDTTIRQMPQKPPLKISDSKICCFSDRGEKSKMADHLIKLFPFDKVLSHLASCGLLCHETKLSDAQSWKP